MSWKTLPCLRSELRLDITLQCGQSFRWRSHNQNQWIGVLKERIWLLAQNEKEIQYQTWPTKGDEDDILRDYFQLDVSLIIIVIYLLSKQWFL